jgi:hypothetical protein
MQDIVMLQTRDQNRDSKSDTLLIVDVSRIQSITVMFSN